MLPIKQVGASVAVAASLTTNVAALESADVVLVTNPNATVGNTAYFSTMIGVATGAAPASVPPNLTNMNPAPALGAGIPILAGQSILVAISENADHYAATGFPLIVTPVEVKYN